MTYQRIVALILALSLSFSSLPCAYASEYAVSPGEAQQEVEEAADTAEDPDENDAPAEDGTDESEQTEEESQKSSSEEDESTSEESAAESSSSAEESEESSAADTSPEPESSSASEESQPEQEEQSQEDAVETMEAEESQEAEESETDPEPESSSSVEVASEWAEPELQEEDLPLEPMSTQTTELLEFIMQHGKNYADETAYPWAYNSSAFRSWVSQQPEAQLTLAQWIQRNHASWLTTTDLTLANHLLLEGILLHKWEQESGPHYSPKIGNEMSKQKQAYSVSLLVGAIPDCQISDSTGDYSFDCIQHAQTSVAMLHALNIKGRMRYDAAYNYNFASLFANINHHNVLCYPEKDDEPYLIEECGGLVKMELYDYVVLDNEKKNCAVVGFNGLDAKHMVIPSQIKGYTVTEIQRTLNQSLFEERGCVEPEIITVPSTVTTIDGGAFNLGACDKIWAVTGMSGVTELSPEDFGDEKSNIRVLNFFDESTDGPLVNVIPARLSANQWDSFQTSSNHFFLTPKVQVMKFEEGITTLGGTGYGIRSYMFGNSREEYLSAMDNAVQELYLPESLRTILPGFAGSAVQELRVYIPSGVTSIGANSFTNNCVLYAESTNTVAREYARTNGIPFIPVKNVVTDSANYTRTWDVDFDLSAAQLTVSRSSLVYTGKELKPDASLTILGKTLTDILGENAWELRYSNNVNAGTATVTAVGKGPCHGTVSASFQITRAKPRLSADKSYIIELGEPQKVSVKNAAGKLHYSVDYSSFGGYSLEELEELMSVTNDGVVTIRFEGTIPLIVRADGDSNHESSSVTIPITGVHNKPHSYEVISEAPAGCDYTGTRTLRCKACLSEKTVVVPALGHDFKVKSVIPATASEPEQQHLKCSRCGESEWISVGSPLSPSNQKTGNLENAKVKLNRSVFTYSGKAKTPAVTVVLNGKVVPSRYYSIRYSNNVKAGKASVQVSATGDPYSGSRKKTFIIRPKKTSVSYVKSQKGQMTVQWKKNTTGKGYEVQYSTDKKFKKKVMTVKVKKARAVKTTIRNLEKGVTYYVRIRAVCGDVASVWSKAKTVKIKK